MIQALAHSANHYGQRHLRPVNLSPLRKELARQLTELSPASRTHYARPPLVHRPESEYLHSEPIVRPART